ncbi:hypothetical protein EBQ34_06610 [Vandammella animalimorsus]|uniref:Uncharacterized protein n=1 Tax=Vandammella animalimorsus TaxID=2029117 RepID=A0A3M6RJA9_9BURK|nr:DUF6776 family protein [Vandammella animalimorsus]RMX15369.1 hypothetical protein EBQ34_06610 [Vandammella animalimorsus]
MRLRPFARRIPAASRRLAPRRLLPWPLRLLLLAALLVLFYGGLRWGQELLARWREQAVAQQQLQRLRQDMQALQRQLQSQAQSTQAVMGPAAVAQQGDGKAQPPTEDDDGQQPLPDALHLAHAATIAQLQQHIEQLQAENQRLRDDLGFYENLLPAGEGGALSIRSLNVQRSGDGQQLHWQILLMQPRRDAAPFNGQLHWQIDAQQGGKPWRLPPAQRQQALQFGRYQRLEGHWQVPADVKVRSVTAIIREGGEGGQERARQTVRLGQAQGAKPAATVP